MARYYVKDLIPKTQKELESMTRGKSNGKLYDGEQLICAEQTIAQFYLSVLGYLNDKIDIREGLSGTYNETGDKINESSVMQQVPGTEIFVDTKSNSDTKYKRMLNCFRELGKSESIESYVFEIESEEKVEEEAETENDMEKKEVDKIIGKAIANNKPVIFTGAPGTGKTYSVRKYVKEQCTNDGTIDDEQYKFVQFHPSYDYSDFVEGLRPVVLVGKEDSTFVRLDGTFKAFCRHIVEENEKNGKEKKVYYFIVDEINRADLAKVFGELMFGLEESYRGERNKFETQYKNLITYRILEDADCTNDADCTYNKKNIGKAIPIEKDVFKDGFYIPENLCFIGTMNDIDRSVDSMDFALRRRFTWIEIKANEIMVESLKSILGDENKDSSGNPIIDKLANKIINMNSAISSNSRFGLTEAYHIGPAYFKNLDLNKFKESLETIFENNIVSILKEYMRGRKQEDVEELIKACRNELLE